ncbi:MAG: HEAT repeat domain-containing protein [Chloroflexota bacterium]
MSKQIVEYHLARLKDKNPQARINSIKELVLLGDVVALEALRAVFENDPDEDVRKVAQNAGRELFKKIRAQSEQAEDAS